MAKKAKPSTFHCYICGLTKATWSAQCPTCQKYNTFKASKKAPTFRSQNNPGFKIIMTGKKGGQLVAPVGFGPEMEEPDDLEDDEEVLDQDFSGQEERRTRSVAVPLFSVALTDMPGRISSGIEEVDQVFGAKKEQGFSEGSSVMLSGDPGVGKSTLLLQICGFVAQRGLVIYGSGEESKESVAARAHRLGVFDHKSVKKNFLVEEGDQYEPFENALRKYKPRLAVMDSLSVFTTARATGASGSVSQMKEMSHLLSKLSSESNTTILEVVHINKSGDMAGPKAAEHNCDVVAKLEHEDKLVKLYTRKNRCGPSFVERFFRMTEKGLIPAGSENTSTKDFISDTLQ